MGPFEVLSKVGENGYVIDIPSDWGIHSTFNIEDLVAYKGSLPSNPPYESTIESNHTIPESTPNPYPKPSTRHYCTDNIESILDDQVTVTRGQLLEIFGSLDRSSGWRQHLDSSRRTPEVGTRPSGAL